MKQKVTVTWNPSSAHLPVEPLRRPAAKAIRPAQAGAQITYSQPAQPLHGIIQRLIREVKPLADAQVRRVFSEEAGCPLRRAVSTEQAHQAHMGVPVGGRSLCLLVACRYLPGMRTVVEAVPVDPRCAPDQELRGTGEPELLDFLRAEAGDTDL